MRYGRNRAAGRGRILAVIVCLPALCAAVFGQAENPLPATIVSAASYQAPVAPDSIASIFGERLASAARGAELTLQGELPLTLGGTSVTINDRPARLFFVSPGQVNCLVPAETEPGQARVAVRSAATGMVSRGTVNVARVAPALFTMDASGKGEGAILNAITFRRGPFALETPQNPGAVNRTRVAIYASGLRHWNLAGNTAAARFAETASARSGPGRVAMEGLLRLGATVGARYDANGPGLQDTQADAEGLNAGSVVVVGTETSGRQWTLPVEYAGRAPGFFGLDQINVVLQRELAGVTSLALTVRAGGAVSNPVNFRLEAPVIPVPPGQCGQIGACVNLSGRWRATESLTDTCTLTGGGESATFTDTYRVTADVVLEEDEPCVYGGRLVLVQVPGGKPVGETSYRRQLKVTGSKVTGFSPAAIALPGVPITFKENYSRVEGEACGDKMTLSGVSRLVFSVIAEGGVRVDVSCDGKITGDYTRLP